MCWWDSETWVPLLQKVPGKDAQISQKQPVPGTDKWFPKVPKVPGTNKWFPLEQNTLSTEERERTEKFH
jgi:hypothetical protein